MIDALKEALWTQFGASIDMLKNAILFCPNEYWRSNKKLFYMSYHTLFFLDYYLTIPPDHFKSALPFYIGESESDIDKDAIDDIIPEKAYSRNELLEYLQFCREKCHTIITGLTEEKLQERWIEEPGNPHTRNYPFLELLLYNMRHVQHHAAQLNLLLRQGINNSPDWVSRATS